MKVKRQGTTKFVSELITTWLNEIREPAILDSFEKLIVERRAMLMIEKEKEQSADLIHALARCKYGDVLHVMHPFPKPSWQRAMPAGQSDKYQDEENRMKCKFHSWQPRKKLLWVTVPWKTTRERQQGKFFILLEVQDIIKLQPSRTERSVRLKLKENMK